MTEQQHYLPSGWRWVKLGDPEIATIIMGQSPPGNTYVKEPIGLPFYQGAADFGELNPTPRIWCTSPKRTAELNDILISVRAPIGPTNLALEKCCIGRGLAAIQPREPLHPFYLLSFLRYYEQQLVKAGNVSTFGSVGREQIEAVFLPLPPRSAQDEIMTRLEAQMAEAQRLRLAAERQMETLQFLVSALHREIFTSSEAKNWPIQPLSELIKSGPSNGVFKPPEFFGKGARLVNVSDLYLGLEVNQTRLGRVEANAEEQVRYSVGEGDVFFCRSSLKFEGVGKCCYIGKIQESTLFECHVIRIRPNTEKIRPDYLAFYCQAGEARKYILRAAKLGTMTTINHDDIRDLPVPVPSPEVQKTVVETVIRKIEQVINLQAKAEQQQEAINALPSAILQEMFGGFSPPVED